MIKIKKKENTYTLQKCFTDITTKNAKTLYKLLKPEEYSEARIAAYKEMELQNDRRDKNG